MTTEAAPEPLKIPARHRVRFPLVFFTMLSLIVVLHLYIGSRLFPAVVMPLWGRALGWTALVGLFVSVPAGMILRRRRRDRGSSALLSVAHFWLGALGILLTTTVVADLTALIFFQGAGAPESVARFKALFVAIVGTLLVLVAKWTALGKARLEHVVVPIPGLGAGMKGLRIVQLSDVHIGDTLKKSFLTKLVERVNGLNADVIAITGDLVDGRVSELREDVAPLANLRARLGVFYVTGNHEYYWDGPAWEAEVKRLGLTVLRNEHRVVERGGDRIVIGGVTDIHGGDFAEGHESRADLAFAGAPAGVPRILLAHQPKSVEGASKEGVALQLSGHTHGGQIFPFNLLVRFQQPAVAGLKKLLGVWVYTHRGTGFWGPPMRFGTTPEIAEIELVPA